MNNYIFVLSLFSLLFFSPNNDIKKSHPIKTPTEVQNDTNRKLQQFLTVAEDLQKQAEVPGVGLAIIANNKVIYTGGLGFSNLNKSVPVTENTLFMIGSTTKAFTGVVAAKLVERGLLDWHKPIINYLPDFKLSEPYIARNMNIEDAFIHMTGLERKDELWVEKPISRKEVFKQVETMKFKNSFRSEWDYNNHMYVVAGTVLEKIADKSWEDLIRQEIYEPLGMENSYTSYQEFMDQSAKSTSYQQDGLTTRPHVNFDNIGPAGSLSSTPKDISKWLNMLVNQGKFQEKSFLQPKEFEYLTSPKGMSLEDVCKVRYYSIGWGANINMGKKYLRHQGGIGGQNAVALVMPEDGFGIFVMTNQRSDYKDILVDYAENIFVKNDSSRDLDREDILFSNTTFTRFRNTILDKGVESARTYHSTIKFKNYEEKMNTLGYQLMYSGQIEKALLVLELNVKDHPTSANAYDSYGEVLLKAKLKEQAIEMYKKSIELNPNNSNAINILKNLKKN